MTPEERASKMASAVALVTGYALHRDESAVGSDLVDDLLSEVGQAAIDLFADGVPSGLAPLVHLVNVAVDYAARVHGVSREDAWAAISAEALDWPTGEA